MTTDTEGNHSASINQNVTRKFGGGEMIAVVWQELDMD